MGFWNKVMAHPAYDAFWQRPGDGQDPGQPAPHGAGACWSAALGAEDIYGYMAVWKAMKPKDTATTWCSWCSGPGITARRSSDGQLAGRDQVRHGHRAWFRQHVLAPFLAHYLKDDAPQLDIAPVTVFETGTNEWRSLPAWPVAAQPLRTSRRRST